MQAAHGRGMKNLLLTGQSPKPTCAAPADVTIRVPDTETFRIQERHLPIYHVLCLALEAHVFGPLPEA
jgi:phosphoheptose isomerase